MNRTVVLSLALLALLCLLLAGSGVRRASATRSKDDTLAPDVDRRTYLELRDQAVGRLRGLTSGVAIDPRLRRDAIEELELQETAIKQAVVRAGNSILSPESSPIWIELGPRPLPNGETQQAGVTTPVTGRATAVVVDPTNSNKVYLGTAQGGVWRSTDGGTSWISIFDTAQSLAIGSLALAPSSPTTLYVGTGEHPGSLTSDSFFGVGVYRIDNADTTATLAGPINPPHSFTSIFSQQVNTTCFGGRAINKILVHPTNPAIVFVSTTGSFAGISGQVLGNQLPPLGLRGLYRSTNATAAPASVTFEKLTVTTDASFDSPGTGNTGIWDLVFEPGNPNIMLATVAGSSPPIGGVFRSTNVLAASPTFTQVLTPTLDPDGLAMNLAINKNAGSGVVTVYVTSNEASSCPGEKGRVRKSIDGGINWTDLPAADGFCGGLCIYSDPIAVDPNNANLVYLGGSSRGNCSDVLQRSGDGGTTFFRDDTGLHSDAHSIFIDPLTAPATVWFANDGGIWKRQDAAAGATWQNRNNVSLGTLQFQSIAIHPKDRFFMIGGSQDNGTEAQQTSSGNWTGAESGDGGFTLIDQSATDTSNVTMYHTFANLRNISAGFARANLGSCLLTKDSWAFRGAGGVVNPAPSCDGSALNAANGIGLTDNVNFYPPMALGPGGAGNPNIVYFGSDRLYRSTNKGDTMIVASQAPFVSTGCGDSGTLPCPISAIGISPANDNVRLIAVTGRGGEPSPTNRVFATITGSSSLTDISPGISGPPTLPDNPNRDFTGASQKYISRAVVDPNNPNVAYLTLSYYAPAGQGIFKTTNLNLTGTGTVTWSAMGNGIPSIPIDAFVVDPDDSNRLFAGTDIGVYLSEDGGANWSPYGTGLPRVAVFDMAIQPTSRTLRIATHGRGVWEIPALGPLTISGLIAYGVNNSKHVPNVTMTLTGGGPLVTSTDGGGNYSLIHVPEGNSYTLTPSKQSEVHDAGISAFDASHVARYAANLESFTANQLIAGDVTNDGTVSAFDASRIARYDAQIPTGGSIAGSWKFLPASLSFNNLSSTQSNQNFQGILMGDVTGNWIPSGPVPALPASSPASTNLSAPSGTAITVALPNKVDAPGTTTIPIGVGDTTNQGIGSYTMDISFDPLVLQPQSPAFDATGTITPTDGSWGFAANTSTSGHLILNAFGTTDLTGQGVLLKLKFNVVGTAGQQTALTWVSFTFNEGNPGDTDINGQFTVGSPTAAGARISGQIVTSAGQPVAGTTVTVSGGMRVIKTITDSEGRYHVTDMDTGRFYTVSPSRANYTFSPAERSFSLLGDRTDAVFTGTSSGDAVNPLDTPEYFVRQQYLDVLGREPDQSGFEYWSNQINQCLSEPPAVAGGSTASECVQSQRTGVASAFFIEQEFWQSGAFIYNLYEGALGRRPLYAEYSADRLNVVGGPLLEAQQQAFAAAFVTRAEFVSQYEGKTTAESFVDALLANVQQASGVDLSSQRDSLIDRYHAGTSQAESRTLVLREVTEGTAVRDANYNGAFVLVEYFGYLHRNPEQAGYDFWLQVLNESGGNGAPANYRGMVCSFITSAEYQRRFSVVVSQSNSECGQ
jgi:hypothetical protein